MWGLFYHPTFTSALPQEMLSSWFKQTLCNKWSLPNCVTWANFIFWNDGCKMFTSLFCKNVTFEWRTKSSACFLPHLRQVWENTGRDSVSRKDRKWTNPAGHTGQIMRGSCFSHIYVNITLWHSMTGEVTIHLIIVVYIIIFFSGIFSLFILYYLYYCTFI